MGRSQRHKLETHRADYVHNVAAAGAGWSVADAAPAGAATVTVNASAFPTQRGDYPVKSVNVYVGGALRMNMPFPGVQNLTGLTPSQQVAVTIAPVNEAGAGTISAAKNVTPT